jgi:hypothetical protein
MADEVLKEHVQKSMFERFKKVEKDKSKTKKGCLAIMKKLIAKR